MKDKQLYGREEKNIYDHNPYSENPKEDNSPYFVTEFNKWYFIRTIFFQILAIIFGFFMAFYNSECNEEYTFFYCFIFSFKRLLFFVLFLLFWYFLWIRTIKIVSIDAIEVTLTIYRRSFFKPHLWCAINIIPFAKIHAIVLINLPKRNAHFRLYLKNNKCIKIFDIEQYKNWNHFIYFMETWLEKEIPIIHRLDNLRKTHKKIKNELKK